MTNHVNFTRRLGSVLLALTAAATGAAQSSPDLVLMYEVTKLESESGGATKAYAVNNTGQIVGWVEQDDVRHSAQWHNRVTTDLHGTVHFSLLHPYALYDQNYSEAYNISDADQIVGTAKTSVLCSDTTIILLNAYVLRPAVLTDLATPFAGDALTNLKTFGRPCPTTLGEVAAYDSAAVGISNANHVVGWADRSDGVTHAFLLTPIAGQFYSDGNADGVNDLMIDLGTLAASDPVSAASAVNDFGQVTGYSYTIASGGKAAYHAFLLTPLDTNADGVGDVWFSGNNGVNTLMTTLGTLGGTNSWGRDINNAGAVVGESDIDTADGEHYTQAFLWQNGTLTALGTLAADPTQGFSAASGINSDGVIVGWAENDTRQRRAFIYKDGQMTDLNTLIFARNEKEVAIPSSLILREARDINDDGVIVGWGTFGTAADATPVGFLLNPEMVSPDILTVDEPNTATTTTTTPGGTGTSTATGLPDFGPPASTYATGTANQGDAGTATTTGTGFLCGAGTAGFLPLTLAGLCCLRMRRR